MRDVVIGLGNFFRNDYAVFAIGFFFQQFGITVIAQKPAHRIGRFTRRVDINMANINTLDRQLGIERLTQHARPANRCRMGVLTDIAAHG